MSKPNVQIVCDGAPVSADNPLPVSLPVGAGLVILPDGSVAVNINDLMRLADDETAATALSALYPNTLFMWPVE